MNVTISRKDVEHVAQLARLLLTEEEKGLFARQLSQILDHAGKIAELDTSEVEPTSHVVPMRNVMREDKVENCLSQKDALSNAPQEESGGFVVPRIV
jgi:aspartyl-tRNA(Asn)/glutamyl-tRNA(Gln) amidotransferase subunit C